MYLPAGAENASAATFTPTTVTLRYYGTTSENAYPDFNTNTNVLKMGLPIAIMPSDPSAALVENEDYKVRVVDVSGMLPQGATQTAKFSQPINAKYSDSANNGFPISAVPLNTDVTFTAGAAGETMKLVAELNGYENVDNELYWGTNATYEAVIGKAPLFVRITSDPSKVYDGEPVSNPDVETTNGVPKESVTFSYSKGRTPIESTPAEPGFYYVTATVIRDRESASDTKPFVIRKAPATLSISVADKEYDGLPIEATVVAKSEAGEALGLPITTSYYQEQENGSFSKLESAPSEVGSYWVYATTDGNDYYRSAQDKAFVSITPKKPKPFLFVDMPEVFVYDNDAVDDPLVWAIPDVTITYYDENGNLLLDENGGPLQGPPKDAGKYKVNVTIPETDTYEAASSDIYFTILPRPAFLSISKTNNLAEESATVTVTMANGLSDVVGEFITLTVEYENPYYATDQGENGSSESPESTSDQDENEPSLTTQDMMNESGEVLIQSVKAPIVKNADGTLTATYKFSHVKAGEYKVTARFEDPNYSVQPVSAQYSKDLRYYIVDAKDKTVTFGDEPFELQVEVSDSSGDEVESPSLSYSVVPADNIPEGLPAVFDGNVVRLSDGECGTVIVESAGLAAIRVEALDDDTHKGGFDYALVTVERAPLCLTVKAFSKVADGKPATVTYSTIDKIDAKYPSNYTGEVSLTYFEKRSNTWIKLDKPPIAVGTYAVVATAREDGNYEGDIAEAEFRIMSPSGPVGPVDPDGPDNPDNPDDPDNPSDEPGGSDNPDSSKDSDDSSNPANPSSQPTSGSGSSSASSPSTGDLLIVWPLVGLAAISLIVLVIAYRRIRE